MMNQTTLVGRRQREIIDLLLKEGVITQEMLNKGREETKRTGLTMEKALEKLGYITEEDVVKVRAAALGLPYMDLSDYNLDKELVELIPKNIAQKYKAIPLFKINNSLSVGMADPQDIVALDKIRIVSKMEMVEPVLVSESGIQKMLDSFYEATDTVEAIVKSIEKKEISDEQMIGNLDAAEEAPIIKLVNLMFSQAVKDRVSDMHIEPEENQVRVRCRIDGLLKEVSVLPKKLQSAIISRVKILSNLDISESRKPQDGRIRLKVEDHELDVRVSTFPTLHGENVVMRILDKSSVLLGLKEVGLSDADLQNFEKLITRPNGIILVTGPTGSGKTSTLYSALGHISTIEMNIITIEDPVEYELPLIRQTQVNPKAGITFATGLRGILRQDPDVIMVGEIRDKETAEVAIQASMTGHLVFSTLHTIDAPSALGRLIDMGVEPFLVSTSVIGIIAQRLVRVVCEKCKEPYKPSEDVLRAMGLDLKETYYHGKGCEKCNNSGSAGRTGIHEMLLLTDRIRRMIDERASTDDLKRTAREQGMMTLRENGIYKVKKGIITPEELLRVTVETEG
jgi:type IV pilus assembly protein PilB